PAAFFTAASLYFCGRLCRRPHATLFVLCALATTGALLSKYTSLLLFPVFALLLLSRWLGRSREAPRPRTALRVAAAAAGLAVLVLLLVHAAYLFKGSLRHWADYAWESAAFKAHSLAGIPIPL